MTNIPASTQRQTRAQQKPFDRSAAAIEILAESADEMSKAMVPAANLYPTGAVVLNQVSALRGAITASQSFTFPTDGYVVAIRATTEDGAALSMASVLLRIQVDGRLDLFSSGAGNGAGYLPFSQISGAFSNIGRYPVRKGFLQANAWSLFVWNTLAGTDVVCDISMDIVDTRSPTL